VHVAIRRERDVVAAADGVAASPGAGDVALPVPLAPGTYTLDLALTTPAATVSSARIPVDTRSKLPLRDARRALRREYVWSEGDEGGVEGVALGECRREDALTATCRLRSFFRSRIAWGPPGFWARTDALIGRASATLRADGIRTRSTWPNADCEFDHFCARITAPARQHVARSDHLAVRVRSRRAARARMTVKLRWRTGERHTARRTLTLRHRLRPHTAWHPIITPPPYVIAAASAGRRSVANISLHLRFPNRNGPRTEAHGLRVKLVP
jgi:hypothetical protein